jgi:hypothetical protein
MAEGSATQTDNAFSRHSGMVPPPVSGGGVSTDTYWEFHMIADTSRRPIV